MPALPRRPLVILSLLTAALGSLGTAAPCRAELTTSGDTTIGSTFVVVGGNSYGALQLTDSSTLITSETILGEFSSGFGAVTVDNATFETSNNTTVGMQGSGNLWIKNQGVFLTRNLIASEDSFGSASITVEGAGSLLQSRDNGRIEIGRNGVGVLNVLDQATVVSQELEVGNGSLVVNGAATLTAETAWVGNAVVDVVDGLFQAGSLSISGSGNGGQVGGAARVRVAGPGARLDTSSLSVGHFGEGSLQISSGALVSSTSNSTTYLGRGPNSIGRVLIDGPDSRWVSPSALVIGEAGYGQLSLSGGALHHAVDITVGEFGNGHGDLEVLNGGTRLFVEQDILAGSTSRIVVDHGASITARRVELFGHTNLQGGSIKSTQQPIDVAGLLAGHGTLASDVNLEGEIHVNGGELRTVGDLTLSGFDPNRSAMVEIDNAALVVEGNTEVGNFSSVRLSNGVADFRGRQGLPFALLMRGEFVVTPGQSQVFGEIQSEAGEFTHAPGSETIYYNDFNNAGSFLVAEDATVTVLGTFSGNGASGGGLVRLEGGASPGFSPGLMAFGGNAELGAQSVTMLEFEGLEPGQQYDQIQVAGSIALNGALDLQVQALPGGSQVDLTIIDAGEITGQFSSTPDLGDHLGNGWRFGGLTYDTTNGDVILNLVAGLAGDYNNDSVVDAADYTLWRDNLGAPAGTLSNDSTGLPIGQEQYAIWRSHYGESFGTVASDSLAAVPSPSSIAALSLGALLAALACMTGGFRPQRGAERA